LRTELVAMNLNSLVATLGRQAMALGLVVPIVKVAILLPSIIRSTSIGGDIVTSLVGVRRRIRLDKFLTKIRNRGWRANRRLNQGPGHVGICGNGDEFLYVWRRVVCRNNGFGVVIVKIPFTDNGNFVLLSEILSRRDGV